MEVIPTILEAHKIIRLTGVPNFLNARISVATQLEPEVWAKYLETYCDQQFVDLIHLVFPLDFDRTSKIQSTYDNLAPATKHLSHVHDYIR